MVARGSPSVRGGRRATGWRRFVPPPHASSLAGWALLPLRAFLGVTFTFAGLQKLANPNFFNAASPSSIQAQLIASERISPLHDVLGHLLRFATPIGVVIAVAELAVGLGTLLGLWTRLAALGGLLLSLTLFLTVSFHSSPYYTGSDIVFLFAWTPLVVAGSGHVLSFDSVIARRTLSEAGVGDPQPVAVAFSVVKQVCGEHVGGRCRARGGRPCHMAGCPFLVGERPSLVARGPDEIDRRAVVRGGAVAAATAGVGLVLAGAVAALGRAIGGAPPASGGEATLSGPHGPAPQSGGGGFVIGPASEVPLGGAARFSDPSTGDPSLVLQPTKGRFVAFDAVCPHAGCTVGYSPAARLIVCPCHGSQFNPLTGAVEAGPAPRGLTPIPLEVDPSGDLTVT